MSALAQNLQFGSAVTAPPEKHYLRIAREWKQARVRATKAIAARRARATPAPVAAIAELAQHDFHRQL